MNGIEKEPEVILEKFDRWLEKGRKKHLIVPARVPDHFENITPETYGTGLSHVYFNELLRKDPSLREIEEEASERIIEAYSGGVLVKFAFPPEWHYNWEGVDEKLLRPFVKLLIEEGLIAEWKGEEQEFISGDRFWETLWEWFFYELVRRGIVDDVRKRDEFYERYCA